MSVLVQVCVCECVGAANADMLGEMGADTHFTTYVIAVLL